MFPFTDLLVFAGRCVRCRKYLRTGTERKRIEKKIFVWAQSNKGCYFSEIGRFAVYSDVQWPSYLPLAYSDVKLSLDTLVVAILKNALCTLVTLNY